MIVSIHQPNFVPYAGFFEKMEQSDIFVILTYCQFEKNNYQNRFYTNRWNGLRVSKKTEFINVKEYLSPQEDWKKITDRYPKLKVFDDCIEVSLMRTNINIILKAKDILGIKTKIMFDSPTESRSTERLVNLCEGYNATTYLSGIGGKKYLDLTKFKESNIDVSFQNNISTAPLIDIL